MKRMFGIALVALLGACAAPPEAKAPPAQPAASAKPLPTAKASDPLSQPPPIGVTPSAPFPDITHHSLTNGLRLRTISRRNLPIVELRLVFFSGTASDGEKPGLAVTAGELTKAGGAGPWNAEELLRRAESLGANLNVATDRDSTRISIAVTTSDLDAALEILAAVATKPRFDAREFTKLKDREIERVKSAAKANAGYAAQWVLFRELFEVPTAVHPYSRIDALPQEFGKLTLADCKTWHAQHMTPHNAVLIAAGDVTGETLERAAKAAFSGWTGERPAPISFPQPQPDTVKRVYLVDRPGSAQSQVLVGVLGPERKSSSWPSVSVLNQVLGGGVAGRLFLDVREKRSLAYNTGSYIEEPARGPAPLVLSAGTQTDKTALAVEALLENLKLLGGTPPTEAEVDIAARYLADSFLFRMETIGALADMTAKLAVLSLPDDYYDSYRQAVRKLEPREASQRAAQFFRHDHPVIVVAGDASKLSASLARFGQVAIVQPQNGFHTDKLLPAAGPQP
jgi:predicted Zn-dependent peptidase